MIALALPAPQFREINMRIIPLVAAASLIASTSAYAGPLNTAMPSAAPAPITLVQEKKDEGVVKKVERNVKKAWKNILGYKFVASCPALFPVNRYECAETGSNKEEARAKCAAKHRFCLVQDKG
jgi:hypothetical protein